MKCQPIRFVVNPIKPNRTARSYRPIIGTRWCHQSRPGLFLILVFWFSSPGLVEAAIPRNQLPGQGSGKPAILQTQYVVDTTDRLSVDQLTNPAIPWRSTPDPTIVAGFTTHPVWCRFVVQQAAPATRSYAFELNNFYIDSLTIYQPDARGGWQAQYTGDLIPFALHQPKTRYPTLYVSLSGTSPQLVYARILSSQHHGYQWLAWDRAVFDSVRLPDIDRYVTFAVVIIMALFILALLLFMHQFVVLRAYALWSLSVCASLLFSAGFSTIYFPQSPYWSHTSQFIAVGLTLPALAYYVVQACNLPRLLPRLVWLYVGFGGIGVFYAGLSFFYRHAYITWGLIIVLALMMGFTLCLLAALLFSGNRPAIWIVISLVLLLPYTYFYGRNAGFFVGTINEDSLKFSILLSTISDPFICVMLLWQATRERIRTAEILMDEKAQRAFIQKLDQLKTDFFTNVSHELRTPVTLLLGPLQSLHSQFPDNQLYALMHRNAGRLQTLINQLLDLAKLDAQQMKNTPVVGTLTDDVRNWVTQFDRLAKSRSVSLTLEQSHINWFGSYDADKVEKIVVNLLNNALKFTPAGGSVTVNAGYTASGVIIEVHDTGVGMTPDVIPHLFDRFYQAAEGYRQETGTGVGLALTYELIHLMNGTITVNSRPGEGSTFTVSLPLQEHTGYFPVNPYDGSQSVTPEPDQPKLSSDHINHQRIRSLVAPEPDRQTDKPLLLLVEDNEDLRIYIRMVLDPQYRILEAIDGQQGLEMAIDALPDLIITDLMMPRLDGNQLCRALRADLRTDHIPLVMLTAKATQEDRLTGLSTGADDYLTKPFLPIELTIRLQNLHRRQVAIQQHLQRTLTHSGSEQANPVDEKFGKPVELTAESSLFLQQVYTLLDHHLDQSDFEVEDLAHTLALSSRTLNRKLKTLLDLNAREMMQGYRLRRGSEMLDVGIPPTQVAYAVGFGSLSSFGRAYKEQYGHAPSKRNA